MNDWVYTVEWSRDAKEFRVVKVPPPRHVGWCLFENYWDAHAVTVRWNEALSAMPNRLLTAGGSGDGVGLRLFRAAGVPGGKRSGQRETMSTTCSNSPAASLAMTS